MKTSDDFDLRRALKALRRDRPPVADLWPGIEARLARRPSDRAGRAGRRAMHGWWTGALAAGFLLAFGLMVAPNLHRTQVDTPALADAGEQAVDPAETLLTAYTSILAAERTQGARWTEQLAVPGGADRIAAARELDASLTELAAALRIEPDSQLLRRLMHQTLQQRAALALEALDA